MKRKLKYVCIDSQPIILNIHEKWNKLPFMLISRSQECHTWINVSVSVFIIIELAYHTCVSFWQHRKKWNVKDVDLTLWSIYFCHNHNNPKLLER